MSDTDGPTSDLDLLPDRALPESFYDRPVLEVTRELVGCALVTHREGHLTAGKIVEVEAYGGPDDLDSHSAFRRAGLVQAMWGPPGRAYVYRAYGVYPCFNTVTGAAGTASAVLVRALEPVAGVEMMMKRLKTTSPRGIASGPGKLSLALAITIGDNGAPLDGETLWLQPWTPFDESELICGPRVGVKRGDCRHWRIGVRGHRSLSRPFPS